jgi:hypothetical protein
MPRFAPRIHVLLASDAPVGLVIRRGPSKCVATLLWDRRRDEFRLGQWLKGRIYERRSDLSPDGRYAIYFAMNGKWTSESKGSWIAISRAPYLKAVSFFPKGDCWYGGGLWTGPNTYWLNDGNVQLTSRDAKEVRRDRTFQPAGNYGGECPGVYYHRLQRDGWTLVARRKVGKWKDHDIFEKNIGKGWTLRKIAHAQIGAPAGNGCYWDEHELVGPGDDQILRRPTWQWAELDGKRLVWAAGGKLFAAKITTAGPADEVKLYDFNDMTFEAVEAPY